MSIDLNSLVSYWKSRIERDLTPFIDPGTSLTLTTKGRAIQAEWQQRQKPQSAIFSISFESGAEVNYQGRNFGYRSFYASSDMADLMSLAKMILQARPQHLFVETKAKRLDVNGGGAEPATRILQEVLSTKGSGDEATLVVMVTGEAGAGKTSVLQQFVRARADEYTRGQTESLLLYINAQGRALARFNEALATELQDLRALLTYHAVSTLVRIGLIIPVIDGFDELLGAGGYEDAFSSLASFIEELDGQGQLIASSRSAYYEQEFVDRANRVSGLGAQVWRQIPIQVLAWTGEELDAYVDRRCKQSSCSDATLIDIHRKVSAVFKGRNEALREKPLFVARTVDLLLSGASLEGTGDLLQELVNAYIERERTEKLLDRSGGFLLTSEQIRDLLICLSEEMWNLETRELDKRSAKEVAEYVLVTDGVPDLSQKIVIERLPSIAFLATGQKAGGIAFEHETFFSYFLAQRFYSVLQQAGSPPSLLLGRSVLPDDVASTTVELLVQHQGATQTIQAVLDTLGRAGMAHSTRVAQVRENAGLLAGVLLKGYSKSAGLSGLRVWNLVFPGGDLKGVEIVGGFFESVEFRRVDLTQTKLVRCTGRLVSIYDILVDPKVTRMELEGVDVASGIVGLRRVDDSGKHSIYDPHEVQKVLEAIGAAVALQNTSEVYRLVAKEQVDILQRFIRAYNRSNPVCTADDNMVAVFRHKTWPRIQKLLVAARVVSEEIRSTGGPQKTFLRRQVSPDQVMAGARRDARVPEAVRSFWDALEREFPPTK